MERVIRQARVSDAAALLAIDRRVIADGRGVVLDADQLPPELEVATEIDRVYAAQSAGRGEALRVAEVQGVVVGYARCRALRPRRLAHVGVLDLAIDPPWQGQGHGRALLSALLEESWAWGLLRLELCCRADNERALALYGSLGFVREGTRRGFVRLPDGALVDDHLLARWCPALAPFSG
jgi:putative acetyltransferase